MSNHPSKKLPPAKRAQLFRFAGQEFASRGYSEASLNRIISQMEMSKSSFYHYFQNKADLFRQTVDHAMAPFLKAMKTFDLAAITADTYWPLLGGMCRDMTQLANQSPEVVVVGRVFYRSLDNPEERKLIQDLIDLSMNWLAGLLRRGRQLGLVRQDLPEPLLVEMLLALGMSADRWLLNNWDAHSDDERVAFADQIFDLFLRVLQPSQSQV